MQSIDNSRFESIDHLRGVAAFMVFSWHFLHGGQGIPLPFEYFPPDILSSLFEEGHVGVSLFMCLSGYLFARLLDGRKIHYRQFVYNRIFRLLPLLGLVLMFWILLKWWDGSDPVRLVKLVVAGLVFPTLPNGGWSITVEFHFYLLLPFLLSLQRNRPKLLFIIPVVMILFRAWWHWRTGGVQYAAYFTLVGRLDQFVLGILAYHYRHLLTKAWLVMIPIALGLVLMYLLNYRGGMNSSKDIYWVAIPALEGVVFALIIGWYDHVCQLLKANTFTSLLAAVGRCSYSIYLLHFFVVFQMSSLMAEYLPSSSFYIMLLQSAFCFLLFVPVAYLSYQYIERPFLRLRKSYILS